MANDHQIEMQDLETTSLPLPEQEKMMDGEHKEWPSSDKIIFCQGCFCLYQGCYLDFPALIGCEQEAFCLCCKSQMVGCKVGDMKETVCLVQKAQCEIVMPKPLIQIKDQCFCLVRACELPFGSDVPNVCGCCFVEVLKDFKPKIGVLKKMSEL